MEGAVAAIPAESHEVEALYRADAQRLWRAIFAFSGSAEVASDAVAETYAQLLRRGNDVRDPERWTWRAAFRIASGALKQSRSVAELQAAAATEHSDVHADADLARALAALPDQQRSAVVLFYYADLPVGEIARRLGSNQLAVRASLSRGRRRLRELLGERDG